MNIAIIDADLAGRRQHRFPNLACMKLSGYYKDKGYNVELKLDYSVLQAYDKVFISKVFTDTPVPEEVLSMPNVEYGGTGFFYDKAPPLPPEIEHYYPDYSLYDEWVTAQLIGGGETFLAGVLHRLLHRVYDSWLYQRMQLLCEQGVQEVCAS